MIPRHPYNLLKLLLFLYSRFLAEWNWKNGDIEGDVGKRTGSVSVGANWRCFVLCGGALSGLMGFVVGNGDDLHCDIWWVLVLGVG